MHIILCRGIYSKSDLELYRSIDSCSSNRFHIIIYIKAAEVLKLPNLRIVQTYSYIVV